MSAPLRIRHHFSQDSVCTRYEGQRNVTPRACITQPKHNSVQTVCARHRAKPQICENKPLRSSRRIVGVCPLYASSECINSRRLILQCLCQRKTRRHCHVESVLHNTYPLPNVLCDRGGECIILILAQWFAEIAVLHRTQQVAVTNAAQFKCHGIRIHSLNGDGRI